MQPADAEVVSERKPSMKERQRQLREDTILDAAEELLMAKGLTAMTLDDLIAEVGISKPTLYQHFSSKEELVGSIMTRCLRDAGRKLRELEASLPPGEALRALIGWFVEESANDGCGPVTDLCITLSLMAQEPVREAEKTLRQEIEALVIAAQKEGSVRTSVPAIFVSQTLLSISKDASYRSMIAEGRSDLAETKQALIRLLLGE